MLTAEQVRNLVVSGESETLEFKRSTGEVRSAAQALCAMLNHRGGHVLFGVDPNRRVVGQRVSDRTLEEIAAELRRIDPPALPTVERVNLGNDLEVIAVTVPEGQSRPYTYNDRAYRRIGNTTSAMSRDEYNQILLERLHGERRWENEAAIGWSVDDLDSTEITRVVGEAIRRGRAEDPGTRDPEELVRGLGLMRGRHLSRAAALLFGKPHRLEMDYPQCLLRVARFRGTDRTVFLDNRQFAGNIFTLLRVAERYLRETLPVAGRVMPGLFERVDDPLYPSIVLREALANAVCHRDYSIGGGSVAVAIYDDRLEVTSSGTLHFGLTPEALFVSHESLPWNPLIARVLYRNGTIDQWGRGTLKMVELMAEADLPRPEIEEGGGCVTVRLRPDRYLPPRRIARDLSERQRAILALLNHASSGLALREIRTALPDAAEWGIKEDLALLRRREMVDSIGHGRGARWHARAREAEWGDR